MAENNRTCFVCQEKYKYCPSCSRDYLKPTWMVMFHDENCKRIFETLQDYSLKEISADEAIKILDQCDLSNYENFYDSSKNVIDELKAIKAEKEKTVKADTTIRQVDPKPYKPQAKHKKTK